MKILSDNLPLGCIIYSSFALQIICDHWFNCHFLNAPIVPGPQPGSSSHLSHVKLIRNTSCPLSKLLSISNTNKFSSVQMMTILVHLMSNNIGKNLKKTRLLILSTYLIIKFSFSFSCAPQRKVILKFSRFSSNNHNESCLINWYCLLSNQ